MSTYYFETITSAQALAFNGQTDTLFFNDPGAIASNLRVTYNPPSGGGPATLTVLDISDNRIVVFGAGLELAPNAYAASGGWAVTNDAGVAVLGGAEVDGLFGIGGADTLHGQGGDDVLQGGQGPDVLDGGAGSDLFLIASDDSPAVAGQMDTVSDWSSADHLSFVFQNGQLLTPSGNAFNYAETTAPNFSAALAAANAQITGGVVEYVSVQVGGDVIVFADDHGDHGTADDAVILHGQTLANIDASNIVFGVTAPHATFISTPVSPPPVTPPPVSPPPVTPAVIPTGGAPGVSFTVSGALSDSFSLGSLDHLSISAGPARIDIADQEISGGVAYFPVSMTISGVGFTYDADGDLTGGTVTGLSISFSTPPVNGFASTTSLAIGGLNTPVLTLENVLLNGDTTSAIDSFFGGADVGAGGPTDDILRGFGGNDTLSGQGGYDTILAGDGNDQIYGLNASNLGASPIEQNYLRGEAGDDTVTGAAGFDDINGNMGNDVLHGGEGDDWVVGGKDNDVQFGDAGGDVVWGNLGDDTLSGGDGADQVRGGQGDDFVDGGAGDDFVSGDRGSDTIVGGAGADLFHGSQDAGIDKVLDFRVSDGDRVMLDPDTHYTVSQVGADTVIDMGSGNQMILVGVQLSTLPTGWIFEG